MAVEGRMRYVKFLLFSCNIIFLLFGLFFIMMGLAVGLGAMPGIDPELRSKSSIMSIVIGIITVLVAFFGCYGAWKENNCMITTFIILQSVYLITEILLTVVVVFLHNQLKGLVLQNMVREYEPKGFYKNRMDKIQQESQCCGAEDFTDWVDFQPDGMSVPDSCCRNVTENCGAGAMNHSYNIYTTGCRAVWEDSVDVSMIQCRIPALIIAFMEVLNIVLACTLMYGIRKGYAIVERQKNHFRT